jgi:hypothetical protein
VKRSGAAAGVRSVSATRWLIPNQWP